MVSLSNDLLLSFRIGKDFEEEDRGPVQSLDIDDSGNYCLTTVNNDELGLYDCLNGSLVKRIYSKKYGCGLARFTHRSNNIIHTSTIGEDIVRYLSFHDNRYLRYFRGHSGRVASLEMSPLNDTFITASLDHSVRLWDLRTSPATALLSTPPSSSIYANFDQTGVIFAVGVDLDSIRLYDTRNYSKGPFSTFKIDASNDMYVKGHSLKFSNDGKYILISTNGSFVYLMDAYDGKMIHILKDHLDHSCVGFDACFSPDANYILSGSEDNSIHFWEVKTGAHLGAVEGAPGCGMMKWLQFNQKYLMFTSGGNRLSMWIPPQDHDV